MHPRETHGGVFFLRAGALWKPRSTSASLHCGDLVPPTQVTHDRVEPPLVRCKSRR